MLLTTCTFQDGYYKHDGQINGASEHLPNYTSSPQILQFQLLRQVELPENDHDK